MQVSVVIPLYNKADTIARTIRSVLAQTHQSFELIIIDDGSTDSGKDIAQSFCDPRLRVIHQENAGVSAARNRGAEEAASDLVVFVDADDEWDPDFLEAVLLLRNRFPQAAVWATAYRITHANGRFEQPAFHGRVSSPESDGLLNYFATPTGLSPLTATTSLVLRPALRAAGGFPADLAWSEDHDTWIRLALRFPIAWSSVPKATIHEDADNRANGFHYLGNYPFFGSYRAFLEQGGRLDAPAALRVEQYLARRHTGILMSKWLFGEREIVREIFRDCHCIPGYRARCWKWLALSCIPHRAVALAWKAKRALAHRKTAIPKCRSMRRRFQD